jgi:hypothetical protein
MSIIQSDVTAILGMRSYQQAFICFFRRSLWLVGNTFIYEQYYKSIRYKPIFIY